MWELFTYDSWQVSVANCWFLSLMLTTDNIAEPDVRSPAIVLNGIYRLPDV